MTARDKEKRRSELLAARRALSESERRAESERLRGHLAEVAGDDDILCAYLPVGTEPGSSELLDELAARCRTVLLPVVRIGPGGEHLPLRWGRYVPGRLVAGRFGLHEPEGPWLSAAAIADAAVVLVPALAVDRRGVRLGRGGGFYDRSLPLCRPGTRLVAVVRDCELVGELPGEPHDVPMTHALTPARGLVRLGECPPADGGSST